MRRLILLLGIISAAQPAFAQPDDWSDDWSRNRRHGGVHLRILRDYNLPSGSTTHDPVIVIGGSATIDGRVEDDVVVIGGTLRVGPQAVIRGDLVTVGSAAIVDPGADISGDRSQTVVAWPDLRAVWSRLGDGWWEAVAFGATVARLVFVLLVSVLLSLVAPRWIRTISVRAGTSVAMAGVVGFAGEVLFVPGVVLIAIALIVSIVGIPLLGALPFLIGVAGMVWTAGFAGVSARLGARVRGQDSAYSTSPVVDLLLGFVAITGVSMAGHLMAFGPEWMTSSAYMTGAAGLVIEYVAWTIGLGAAIGSLVGRQASAPPPVPMAVATPSPTAF